MRRFGIVISAAVLFSLLVASQAHADYIYWTGTTGSWHDPLNWDNGIPTSGDSVYIDNGGTAQISADTFSDWLYLGYTAFGAVEQTGATNTVDGLLQLGVQSGSSGRYNLIGGELHTQYEYIGSSGTGEFIQTGGTHRVDDYLRLGAFSGSGSSGRYTLNDGELLVEDSINVGHYSSGEFNQNGGTITVGDLHLGHGTTGISGVYNLTDGLLSVEDYILVGWDGTGEFNQSGGSISAGYLIVKSNSSYTLSGGTLTIGEGAEIEGVFDFAGGASNLNVTGGVVDFTNSTLTGANSAAFSSAANSLTIFPSGFDPLTEFSTFYTEGVTHTVGNALVIPSGQTITGHFEISDPVEILGTLVIESPFSPYQYEEVVFNGDLTVHNGGRITIDQSGSSCVIDNGSVSTLGTGGQMDTGSLYVGYDGTANLNQTGGSNTLSNCLYIGEAGSSSGTYGLSAGTLDVENVAFVGHYGQGEFNQVGGTCNIHELYVAYSSNNDCTYNLSDGELTVASSIYVGNYGNGDGYFNQSGGSVTIDGNLNMGIRSSGEGIYNLADGVLTAGEEHIGLDGRGYFTQSGGTNTVGYLYVKSNSSYTLGGGTLTITGNAGIYGAFDFAGGNGALNVHGGVVDFSNSTMTDAGSASFASNADTLTIFPSGFDPETEFASFSTSGVTHVSGATLVIPSGQTITSTFEIGDHVVIQGTVVASGGEIGFDGGFTIADGGTLNSTDQVLYVDNGASAFMEAGNSNLITSTLYIGHSATGQFTQNGGTYAMQATWGDPYLYLGLESGSSGTYNLNGGEMLLEQLRIGTGGTGEFNQSGGVVNIAYHKYHDFVLDIGYSSGSMGTYNLSAGELDVPLSVRVAYNGTGEFNQTGGTHAIAEKLYLGYNSFGVGTYNLTDGVLTAESEYVGYYGTGVFNQSGGTNSMSYGLTLSYGSNSSGAYNLSGGELSARYEYVGYYRLDDFHQTGGTNTIEENLYLGYNLGATGNYILEDGQLFAHTEYVGHNGIGNFTQTGGINTVRNLYINSSSTYTLSGGTLRFLENGEIGSLIDFANGNATFLIDGGFVDLRSLEVANAGSANFVCTSRSIVILPEGQDLSSEFGSYNILGTIYSPGSPLIIGPGKSYTGQFEIDDHVEVQGALNSSGGALILNGGFTVSDGGTLNTSYGLVVDNGHTGRIMASGGQVLAREEIIGQTSTGTFVQESGYNTIQNELVLGDENGSSGVYNLSNGELSAGREYIGYYGTGEFNQTGGTNTVGSILNLGNISGSSGTYALSGGVLSAEGEYVGGSGTGVFNQSGGTNSTRDLYIGPASTYRLSSGTLGIKGGGSISGTIDFDYGAGFLSLLGGITDIQDAAFLNAGSASFETATNSLTILPAGCDPETTFGSTDLQGIFYTPGTTMIVYEGQSFTGHYDFDDPLEVRGTLIASGGMFGFKDSLTISNGGTFDTGTETLTLKNGETATIAASGGTLITPEVYIGYSGEGEINQEGGTVTISGSLHLAYDVLFCEATYNLNDGALATTDLIVGDGKGRGTFNQSGGTLSVSGTLDITAPFSRYNLDGGSLEAHDLFLAGNGILNITNSDAYVEISGSFAIQDNAVLMAVPGTTIHMTGSNFENTSTSLTNLGWLQNTTFIFEDSSDTDTFEIASYDYGLIEENFYGNFGLEGLVLAGSYSGTLQLLDAHVNFTGLGPSTQSEALYVRTLVLGGHATLDLNGYNIYALEFTSYGGEVLNGEINVIPEPGTIFLMIGSASGLAVLAGLARRKCKSIGV